jgi:hypothetical protein
MKLLVAIAVTMSLVSFTSFARADAPAPPELKIVSTGKGPTKQLRFEAKKGTKLTMEIVQESAMARGPKGKVPKPEPTPQVRTALDLDITDVQPNGDFRIDLVYRKAEMDTSKLPPDAAKNVNALLGGLVGTKGYAVVTARGVTKDTGLDVTPSAPPELKQQLEALRSLQGQIVSPFPEEAVGVGARWESNMTVEAPEASGSLVVKQNAKYELVELAGTRGKMTITLSQSGKSKDGKLTTAVTGKGEVVFDLAKVGVTTARFEMRSEVSLEDKDFHGGQVNTTSATLTGRAR